MRPSDPRLHVKRIGSSQCTANMRYIPCLHLIFSINSVLDDGSNSEFARGLAEHCFMFTELQPAWAFRVSIARGAFGHTQKASLDVGLMGFPAFNQYHYFLSSLLSFTDAPRILVSLAGASLCLYSLSCISLPSISLISYCMTGKHSNNHVIHQCMEARSS